jgi:serine/threonine protein kinase
MHEKRIIHRDLKPENIMLRSTGSMSPVIVDFGLATPADI